MSRDNIIILLAKVNFTLISIVIVMTFARNTELPINWSMIEEPSIFGLLISLVLMSIIFILATNIIRGLSLGNKSNVDILLVTFLFLYSFHGLLLIVINLRNSLILNESVILMHILAVVFSYIISSISWNSIFKLNVKSKPTIVASLARTMNVKLSNLILTVVIILWIILLFSDLKRF